MTRVRSIELRLVGLPLVRPFRTSFGVETEKTCILARVETDDAHGWGECVAGVDPSFSEEFNEGAWLVISRFLAPALLAAGDIGPAEIERVQRLIRRESVEGAQDIEDAACLVFSETQLASIAERMDDTSFDCGS